MFLDSIENEKQGYKYALTLCISLNGAYDKDAIGPGNICIADTRDECIEQIKATLAKNLEANNRELEDKTQIYYDKPIINRLGADIHWYDKKGDKSWWWLFSIIPVKYIS